MEKKSEARFTLESKNFSKLSFVNRDCEEGRIFKCTISRAFQSKYILNGFLNIILKNIYRIEST